LRFTVKLFQSEQVIFACALLRFPALAIVRLGHQRSRPAILNVQKAFIGVCFVVGATHGIIQCGTNLLAARESESSQTPFNRHNVHVFSATKMIKCSCMFNLILNKLQVLFFKTTAYPQFAFLISHSFL